MIKFIGEYRAKIDDKGRLIFPSAFKALMPKDEPMQFVVRKDVFEDCLEMFTYAEWERQSEEVKAKVDFFNREHAMFWRSYMRNRATVEPDPKLGRITIPKRLLEAIGATKEVVFSGNDHKIEIWSADKYDESEISEDLFISLASNIAGKH